jgi:hypothetical protein
MTNMTQSLLAWVVWAALPCTSSFVTDLSDEFSDWSNSGLAMIAGRRTV